MSMVSGGLGKIPLDSKSIVGGKERIKQYRAGIVDCLLN